MIDKRNFKNEQISLLGLGTMRLPCKTPLKREANPMIDYAKGQKLVDFAYKNGVNYYDTARVMNITPLEAAKLYVKEVADAGIDCAKFQSYKANTIVSKNSPAYWDTSKEPTKTQYELFQKFDSFGKKESKELSDYAHKLGIDFTSNSIRNIIDMIN